MLDVKTSENIWNKQFIIYFFSQPNLTPGWEAESTHGPNNDSLSLIELNW